MVLTACRTSSAPTRLPRPHRRLRRSCSTVRNASSSSRLHMNNMSVLMVINTTGLQYDDRLRKEVGSLRSLGADVRILSLEYATRAGRHTVYEGIPATTVELRSRGWFTQGHGLV